MLAYSSATASSSMKFGSFFGDYFISIRKQEGQFTVKGNKDLFIGHQIGEEGTFLQWEWTGLQLVVRNDRYGLCPASVLSKTALDVGSSNSIGCR